jgi:hypothetical protein
MSEGNGLTLQALADVIGQLDRRIATTDAHHEDLRVKVTKNGDTTLRIEDLTRAVAHLAAQVSNGFASIGARQDDFAAEMALMRNSLFAPAPEPKPKPKPKPKKRRAKK